eukprot:1154903-Pelagomonas_calceolata.AAC.8
MGVWRVNGTTRLQDLAVRRLFLLFPIACLVVTSFVHTEQSGHEGYRQASWHFLLTGLYCGDVNLYNFIGPAQFYNVFKPIVKREFVVDLRKRLQGVWNADALAEHGEHMNKIAKYHHWMALPLRPLSVHGAPFYVP